MPNFHKNRKINEVFELKQDDGGLYTCPYCRLKFKHRGISNHIWRKHTEEGKQHGNRLGQIVKSNPNHFIPTGWNKGLTKDTNESMRKISRTIHENFITGKFVYRHSEEMKKELSRIVHKRIDDGKFILSCGRAKKVQYESKMAGNICVHGTWELKFAKWCDDNEVQFVKNKIGFKYMYSDGKEHTYFPDFNITKLDLFVEVKGYETEKDKMKWSQFPYKLVVLKREQINRLNKFKLDDLQKYVYHAPITSAAP